AVRGRLAGRAARGVPPSAAVRRCGGGRARLAAGPVWQAPHRWPPLEMGRGIAAQGTDGGRPGLLPWQVIDTGNLTPPIWIVGLVRLWRGPWRLFVWAYAFLLLVFLITGGKHYYTMGAYPALWAAGAQVVERWRLRSVMFGIAALTTIGLLLPVYPLRV